MKEYLSQKGIAYTEYDVSKNRDAAREMIQKTRQMSVPVTTVNGEFVVGFKTDKLDELLSK